MSSQAAGIGQESDKYEVLEKIGCGSFGVIQKVRRKADNKILCRKEITYIKMSQKEREQLHAEFSILNSLRHPNIVGYYHREHLKVKQELHIYMEYCDGGDLSKVIKGLIASNQYAEEEFVWSIFAQLVTALYRCHYGVDPPEVGKNYMGSGQPIQQKLRLKNQIMILHRDLKPDNVFLGADNSVKLGDFGLSKLMQSHDFASTYVGTPYYMSPEICAAEKYTLHSDIWSLGCIMYELCTRKPPFDARTHFHLVQKIKEGRFDQPIPNIYSAELQNVIKSCLKTNPHQRPDTATLLQLPVVRLMRKEREAVEVGRLLQIKSDEADEKLKALDAQLATIDLERQKALAEIDSTVRREWEVKARLEIDRQIALETEKLRKEYESQVTTRVQEEVEKHLRSLAAAENTRLSSGRHTPSDIPQSSISTNEEIEFPSQTDLTSLSFDSPMNLSQSTKNVPLKKSTRTPFARCRTTYDSPMDVHMASPSPLPVSNNVNSLALSPRRLAPLAPTNIFATAAEQRGRWEPHFLSPTESADSEDEGNLDDADDQVPDLPSPTFVRKPLGQDPFKIPRPHLQRQATAPVARLQSQQAPLFAGKPAIGAVNLHTMFSKPKEGRPSTVMVPSQITVNAATAGAGAPRPTSPNRRISKVPMIIDAAGSPTRRPSVKKLKAANAGGEEMLKAVTSKNMFGAVGVAAAGSNVTAGSNAGYMGNGHGGGIGRTLVELSQEKAQEKVMVMQDGQGEGAVKMAARVIQWDERDVPVWDPERDEMPSPFLARKGRAMA